MKSIYFCLIACLIFPVSLLADSFPSVRLSGQFGGHCSGALVTSKVWNQRVAVTSALHCVPNESLNGWKIPGVAVSSENKNIRAGNDFFVGEVLNFDLRFAEVLTMAKALPQVGARIILSGFPVNQNGNPVTRLVTCSYYGQVLLRPSEKSLRLGLFHIALCPKLSFWVGISGGAVTNESGEYIGSITSFEDPSKMELPVDLSEFSIVHFSSLTEVDFIGSPILNWLPTEEVKFTPTHLYVREDDLTRKQVGKSKPIILKPAIVEIRLMPDGYILESSD